MPVRKRGRGAANVTQTRMRSCGDKIRYETEGGATRAMWGRIRRLGANPDSVNVYPCKFNERDGKKHWHVGHTPGNLRKR